MMQRFEAAEDKAGLSRVELQEAREYCVCEVWFMFKQQNNMTSSAT